MRVILAIDAHRGILRLRQVQKLAADGTGFRFRQQHKDSCVYALRLAVLRTLIWRKRATGQPWLTALAWVGSPLPSFAAPFSSYVASPPNPSQAFQKSVVRD